MKLAHFKTTRHDRFLIVWRRIYCHPHFGWEIARVIER